MSKKIISRLMLARTTRSIAITLCISLLSLLLTSLAACSFVTLQTPDSNRNSALAQPLDQSAFVVRDLAVSPGSVSKGESVTIVANVMNTSAREGVYNAELKINNARVALKTVIIPAGGTQTLNFVVPASAAGTYKATFGDLSGEYTVADQGGVLQAININNNPAPDAAVPSCCTPLPSVNSQQTTSSNAASCCNPVAANPPAAPTSSTGSFGGGCCGR